MPFPAEVHTVRVVGQYLDAGGKPMSGRINFKPSVEVAGSGVVVAGSHQVVLDSNGKFSIELPATTNSGLEPYGWVYDVQQLLSGSIREYQIQLDPDVSEVNIDDLVPVTTTPQAERFATKPYVDQAVSTLTSSAMGKVSKAGDSMTGPLVLVGNPTIDLHAATKWYVDDSVNAALTTAAQDANQRASERVAKTGDIMTGPLVLLGGSSDLTVGGTVSVAGRVMTSGGVTAGSGGSIVIQGLTTDVFSVAPDGTVEIGDGGPGGRDVNLRREAANVMRTDDRLVVGGNIAGVGSYANLPKGIGSYSNNAGLIVGSSYAGGDDDGTGTDSTGRINLYSYQRANVGSFGENIRNFIMRSDAKTMQAFYMPVQTANKKGGYDGTSRDPMTSGVAWKPVVWQGAHYEANSHASVHGHWELEIADASGALQGRLEIPFIDQSTTAAMTGDIANVVVGVDYTNIRTNLADFSVRAQNITSGPYSGQNTALRVGGNNTVNKDVLLSISSDMQNLGRRWIIRANTDAESGSNAGTNFQIIRTDDSGSIQGTALFIERKTGNVTLSATGPVGARLGVVWGASGTHGVSVQPSASPGAAAGFDAQMTASTDRAFQTQVTSDTSRRWVAYADGKFEWGDGSTRDVNLYRGGAGRLKTDGNFHVAGQVGVGQLPDATAAVGVTQTADAPGVYLTNTNSAGNVNQPMLRADSSTNASLLMTARVIGDPTSRFIARINGELQWGDGTNARDVVLYRDAADRLRLEDSLRVDLRLGVGQIPDPNARLGLTQATDVVGIYSINSLASGNTNQPHLRADSGAASSLLFASRVTGDTTSRFVERVDGHMQWGDGTNARDTNLYRGGPDKLKTDDEFQAAAITSTGDATVGGNAAVAGELDVTTRLKMAGFLLPAVSPKSRMPKRRPATAAYLFQTGHGWTAGGAGTASSDLNSTAEVVFGTQSVRVTTTGTATQSNVSRPGLSSFNLTSKAIRLTFKVADVTKLDRMAFYVGSSSFASYFQWTFHTHSAVNPNIVQSGEWMTVVLQWADVTSASGTYSIAPDGTPSTKAGFTDLRFAVYDNGNALTYHLNAVEVIDDTSTTFPNGVISVTFDDSYLEQYTMARPKMDTLGFRGTAYTIAQAVGSNNAVYMDMAKLRSLQNTSGWEVAGHAYSTTNHGQANGFASLAAEQVHDDFTRLKLWLAENGFHSDNFAYPKGHFDLTTDGVPVDQIAAKYWATSRTIVSETKESFPPATPQRILAKTSISSAGTTVASVAAAGGMLDRCANSGDWLILCLHKLTTGTVTASDQISQTDFNTLMDAIAARSIPVLPIHEVIEHYS